MSRDAAATADAALEFAGTIAKTGQINLRRGDVLPALGDVWRAREQLDKAEIALVEHARSLGASWSDVGRFLRISKQAAWLRFGQHPTP